MSKRSKDAIIKDLRDAKAVHDELAKKAKAGTATTEELSAMSELEVKITTLSNELKEAVENVTANADGAAMNAAAATQTNVTTDAVKSVEYTVKDDEKHLVHAELTKGSRFDSKTGKEISSPYVQKFSVPEFAQFEKLSTSLGYTVRILHNPNK